MKIQYPSREHVHALHDVLIEEFGGAYGLRELELLESAIEQPRQSFGGEELYSRPFEKAACYAFGISENLPFLDGNKRTAASTAATFLDINGYEMSCQEGEIYKVMMQLANKRLSRDQLANWFKKNSKKKTSKTRSKP